MLKKVSLFLIAVMLLTVLPAAAYVVPEIEMQSGESVQQGDFIDLEITVSNIEEIRGIDLTVSYDPDILDLRDVVFEDESFTMTDASFPKEGECLIRMVKALPDERDEDALIATAAFKALADAATGLTEILVTDVKIYHGGNYDSPNPADNVPETSEGEDFVATLRVNKASSSSSGNSGGSSRPSGGTTGGNTGGSIIIPTQPQGHPFTDIPTDVAAWADESITALYKKGVINGRTETTFDPNGNVTRAEFTKMLVLALGLEAPDAANPFTDVAETDWFAPYVKVAAATGVTTGTSETTFSPSDPITREQMCTMIVRAVRDALGKELGTATAEFADNAEISDWAIEAVAILENASIVNGIGDGYFAPKMSATRAQTAKVLYGVTELLL